MTAWWILLAAALLSGLASLRPWWSGQAPAPLVLVAHAGSGLLVLLGLLLLFQRDWPQAQAWVAAVAACVASGAYLFSARHKQRRFPRLALWFHLASAAVIGALILL